MSRLDNNQQEIIATSVEVENEMIHLSLSDGSTHGFPVHYYPRLHRATQTQLREVSLRVGGRALRWESLDEDIWISDAISQNYPKQPAAVAEQSSSYKIDKK